MDTKSPARSVRILISILFLVLTVAIVLFHISGIGEIISTLYPQPTSAHRRRHSGGSTKLTFEASSMSPPRPLTPPRSKSPHSTFLTNSTDRTSHFESLSKKQTIRTSCGLERSSGYHYITQDDNSNLSDSSGPAGAYFFAPLHDVGKKDDSSNLPAAFGSTENRSRLFLVGATFNPIGDNNFNDLVSNGFNDTMLEHLLSVGTFLRGDDLFVDVGKTNRHN